MISLSGGSAEQTARAVPRLSAGEEAASYGGINAQSLARISSIIKLEISGVNGICF